MSEREPLTRKKKHRKGLPTIRIVETDEVCPPELEEAGYAALLAMLRRAFDEEDADRAAAQPTNPQVHE